MMNRVELIGRICKEPELKNSTNGEIKFVNFSLAVDRNIKTPEGEKNADFISCVAFNRSAEFLAQYVHQGDLLSVEGRIQSRQQTGNDGINRTVLDVVCESVQFLKAKNPNPNPSYQNNNYRGNNNQGYSSGNNNYNSYQQPQTNYQPNNGYNAPVNNGYNQNVNNPQNYQDNSYSGYDSNQSNSSFDNMNRDNQQEEKRVTMPSFNVNDEDLPF